MRAPTHARPEPSDLPQVGEVVAHRYLIERFIARGGMSHVFAARHTTLGSVLALKVLDPKLFQGVRDARLRFDREARLASKLRHPSIVEVFDVGMTEGGLPFIAMELLDGPSLAKILREHAPLPWPRTLNLILQVLDALQVAHANGAVHRDVKPDNCLVIRGTDHLKLLDFGIARVLDETQVTVAGSVMGTPHYLSPEQAQGATTDARTDVYSAAIVLYEMLTGHTPFEEGTTFEIVGAHINEPPPPLDSVIDTRHLPDGLTELLDRALAKSPAARPPNAGSFAAELRALRRVAPERRIKPMMWIGAAAAAFIIGLSAVGIASAFSDDAKVAEAMIPALDGVDVPAPVAVAGDPEPELEPEPEPEQAPADPELLAEPVAESDFVDEPPAGEAEAAATAESTPDAQLKPKAKRGPNRKRQVTRALRKAASSCAKFAPPFGAKVSIKAKISASGSVSSVEIQPPYRGSVLGRCVARAVGQVEVGRGAPMSFDQRVRVGG